MRILPNQSKVSWYVDLILVILGVCVMVGTTAMTCISVFHFPVCIKHFTAWKGSLHFYGHSVHRSCKQAHWGNPSRNDLLADIGCNAQDYNTLKRCALTLHNASKFWALGNSVLNGLLYGNLNYVVSSNGKYQNKRFAEYPPALLFPGVSMIA